MEEQGGIPPWVSQVVPTVLNLLTNVDDSAHDRKALKLVANNDNDSNDTNHKSGKEGDDLQSE